ncbi:MAG: hypothetical protein IPK67_18555 [Planctomycetes bacterium]|nr:hypothetical protein [Planctomycetota bacterium]
MKLPGVRFWLAALSLALVVGIAVVDLRRTSPGELSRAHARDEKLEGGANCSACHGGFFSGMTESCSECHEPISEQIENASGLHGTIGDRARAEQCSSCHSEHHGPGFELVNRQSFLLAGVSDPQEFDHQRIGWRMDGAHLDLACSECHEHAFAPVLPEGAKRFIGLEQDCASCHEDPHEGRMKASCASCHGQATWQGMNAVGHEKHLWLVGGHGDLDCRQCHAKDTSRALEAMEKDGPPLTPRTCVDCHDSPHAAAFVAGNVTGFAGLPDNACIVCHGAEHETFRDERLVLTPEQHLKSGFPVDVPHDEVQCDKCHAPEASFAQRYPGRSPDQCSRCHADAHAGQFAEGPFATGDCLACHERTRWTPHTFDVEKHGLAEFTLTGSHATTECNDCHEDPPSKEYARLFRGHPGQCEDCHADVHGTIFATRTSVLSPLPQGECARCHGTQTFAEGAREKFDHSAWTGFVVDGAHAQAECEVCHVPRAEPDLDKRRFGRVEEHFDRHRGCFSCHQDPHEGRFDDPRFPSVVDQKQDCARCHDTTSFRNLWHDFDHGRWTDFELRDGHRTARCSDCHTPRPKDGFGRSWEPALGTGCADCHDDPHGGQFAPAAGAADLLTGATDCAACHDEGARRFSTFDHERDSRFPLGETHRNVACDKCHLPEPNPVLENGPAVIRYRPLGVECSDCHGVHEEVLLRRKPVKR